MSNINEEYIEEYIRSILPKNDDYLVELEKYSKENHIPIVHPEVANFLKVMIKITKAEKILELGTAIGYSALIMANAMESKGKIVTIERREDMIELAKENIKNSETNVDIEIIKGEAQKVLPSINDEFDLIFLDAAKSKYMDFLPYCINNLKTRGIIISDNVLFKGMVANDQLVVRRKKTIVRRMREYLEYISNNEELETSVIPIGDGIALSYKKEVQK
ncbi:O-methyltransferase [Caldisalinibacter kiritimatiensis]|uniref:tRNA 5-hydroxyuridine methyltransferase n=1 Tax=Caldisalinibacter kiritimatiensis TaxID=1304284 RepID=R1ASJ3_9FIRM|nr:O-methyltransferase [Caldisalinibacter kiritimatiensis]EOD00123.1 O-methyltransferase family protein [Caldisalinibacter kiritimatiensis]